MQAGKLRNRGRLYSPPITKTARGQIDKDAPWVFEGLEWCSVRDAGDTEVMRGRQPTAEASHVVGMRYRDDVRATWKIVVDGKDYHILGVSDPDDRKRTLVLDVKELA